MLADVREALRALQARIMDSPMPIIMLEEVVAARGSRPDESPETRPLMSCAILDEYHNAEEKLAQARADAWARQRQYVADKVLEKRQGKAGGNAPCSAAAPSTANVTHVTLGPSSSADAGVEDTSRLRADIIGRGTSPGEAFGERRRPEEREEGSGEARKNVECKEGKEEEGQEDAKVARNLSMLNLQQRKQLMAQIKETKKELDALQKSGWGGMESAIASREERLQSLRAQLASLP
eukprot:gene11318-biopygen861